ncbi:MAG TPA: PQQ-binding-like beta-propeller repeat protein [Chthoniobacteraceae bacterium]|jgi:outer membrane protein assembly factor BamB|nr:PQQ-binding-like beta-propeller repeat protein [Chthoniobacteraceae bacterium]
MKTSPLSALAFSLLALTAYAAPKKPAPAAPAKATPAPAVTPAVAPATPAGGVTGWLNWRGPDQNGTSRETGLPEKVDAKSALWSADFPGQSAPVIANGKLYINGYLGEGPDLQEVIACFDAETGQKVWDARFNDFLSDTVYNRYATSSPTIDPETGNVYMLGTQGIFACFTADGKKLWEHSMMEEFGRLTFPNSRTATPTIDQDLVIIRGITSNWGAQGAAGDRFYAFDKKSGELVWSSSPAGPPQDNTFSQPFLTWLDGKRVFISAAGDSSVIGVNARTGDPLFRFPVARSGAKGGINASIIRYKDSLLVIHESENLDTSEVGRSASYKVPQGLKAPAPGQPQLFTTKDLELWRNPLGNLAGSPCLVGNTLYEVTGVGEAAAVNADTGEVLWRKKLAPEQRQSSPFYADGKLYIALYIAGAQTGQPAGDESATGGNGEFIIMKPGAKDAAILSRTTLEGRCYGSPIAYNGKVYVQTDHKFYCFGKAGNNAGLVAAPAEEPWPKAGPAAKLQIIPNEANLHPGDAMALRFRSVDANGFTVEESVDPAQVKLETFIPPTALVKATMKGSYADGKLTADKTPVPSAGAFQATFGELKGVMRGKVLQSMPINQDFEAFELTNTTGPGLGGVPAPDDAAAPADPTKPAAVVVPGPTNWNVVEPPTAFQYPPLPWNGARFRFEIRKAPGEGENKALCKTIDNTRFQRGQLFVGHDDFKNYTVEADLMTEGNKRKMSEIGVINQRYRIILKGNAQSIEINSNEERVRESVPFKWSPNEWYHLKTRVDVDEHGAGVVRAKAWKKGEVEPEGWAIEMKHLHANDHGCPGVYGFAGSGQRAWVDNLKVTPNNDGAAGN